MEIIEKTDDIIATMEILKRNGVDPEFVILETFLGYQYRKGRDILYEEEGIIPTKLIRLYYMLNPNEIMFDNMKKKFISHYIKQESELESAHTPEEMKGLRFMYKYLHENDMDKVFEEARKSNYFCKNYTSYILRELHSKLYTFAPYSQYGGFFRNEDVFLPGTGTELSEWSMIRDRIDSANESVLALKELAKHVKTVDDMLAYLDLCVELKCLLIKIHPFKDGNGRTIRCFINDLLENVNLPPIYIRSREKTAYHQAMNLANNEGDFSAIKNFYRYKVIDSIIELDINERIDSKKGKQKIRQ